MAGRVALPDRRPEGKRRVLDLVAPIMKVLVTGGAGFIGSHIVDRLVQEGYEVVVVDNLSTGKRRHVNRAARFYRSDIRGWWLERVFRRERPAIVSLHAAQIDVRRSVLDPTFDADVNVLGMLNVLRQAIKYGVRKVIFASSGGAVYGEPESLPVSESHPTRPASPHGIYNVGTGKETTINELFAMLAGLINPSVREAHGPAKRGEQVRIALDSSRLHRELDWEPKVSLKDGLARTADYYRKTVRSA